MRLQDEVPGLEEVGLGRRGAAAIGKEELQLARPLGGVQGHVVVGDLDARDEDLGAEIEHHPHRSRANAQVLLASVGRGHPDQPGRERGLRVVESVAHAARSESMRRAAARQVELEARMHRDGLQLCVEEAHLREGRQERIE